MFIVDDDPQVCKEEEVRWAMGTKARVLVVDDDPGLRKTLSDILRAKGYAVVAVDKGKTALEMAKDENPIVALIDLRLEDMSGLEVMREIKKRSPATQCIVLTGHASQASAIEAVNLGAYSYMHKPYDVEQLMVTIRRAIEKREVERALRESETKYRLLVHNLPNIVFKGYRDWSVHFIDDKIDLLTGYKKEEFDSRKMNWADIVVKEDIEKIKKIFLQALKTDGAYVREYRIITKTGDILWIQEGSQIVCDGSGEIEFITGAFLDITERKRAEKKIHDLAYYDGVTRLPNRQLFREHLSLALAHAKRHKRLLAVLFLDLDHFKQINDTLGHHVGDSLLRCVADRLKKILRKSDLITRHEADDSISYVSRFGGDEFVLLLTDLKQPHDAASVAQRALYELSKAFVLEEREIFVSGSIGISLYPSDGEDIDTLIKNADTAMYHAKNQGRNNFQFYVDSVKVTTSERRLILGTDLRGALEREELILYYQPQLDINTEKIIGTEALIRWLHPDFGLVSPTEFIPLAEDNGLIEPITKWVLQTACAQNMAWQAAGFPPMRVAVNVSNVFFKQRKVVETMSQVLNDTGMAPHYLEIELMQSALMQNQEETIRELRQLKAMGVRVAIDDFGSGYSSLACLKCFPLDALKIDRSFVKDISTDRDSATITAAIITMAHSLQLNVVAEGVETEQQLTFLRAQGCDEMQGYLFSQPIPSSDIMQFLPAGSL